MQHLRCLGNVLHGIVVDEGDTKPQGIIEFRCKSKFCGRTAGVVVLHRFDLSTGELHTRQYLEPPTNEGRVHGASEPDASVRTP